MVPRSAPSKSHAVELAFAGISLDEKPRLHLCSARDRSPYQADLAPDSPLRVRRNNPGLCWIHFSRAGPRQLLFQAASSVVVVFAHGRHCTASIRRASAYVRGARSCACAPRLVLLAQVHTQARRSTSERKRELSAAVATRRLTRSRSSEYGTRDNGKVAGRACELGCRIGLWSASDARPPGGTPGNWGSSVSLEAIRAGAKSSKRGSPGSPFNYWPSSLASKPFCNNCFGENCHTRLPRVLAGPDRGAGIDVDSATFHGPCVFLEPVTDHSLG